MSGLQANTGGMNNNGKQTVANSEYLQNELTSLRNNIDSLMGIWRGLSANEFNKSYEEQARNFDAFRQLLNDLGEEATKELAKEYNPYGLEQNKTIARMGGNTAKVARKDLENKLNRSVITSNNNLNYKYVKELDNK